MRGDGRRTELGDIFRKFIRKLVRSFFSADESADEICGRRSQNNFMTSGFFFYLRKK
jgi:hypothetical protein